MAIEIISNTIKSIGEFVSSKRLGKIVVISKSGEIIGKVTEIRTKGFNVEGVIYSKQIGAMSEFVDKQFIKVFNQNELLLNINPVTALVGMTVYDNSGRRLGTVTKVIRKDNKNEFSSIVVKDKVYSRPILVEKDHIDIMKKNIILNIDYLEYSDALKAKKEREKNKKKKKKKK